MNDYSMQEVISKYKSRCEQLERSGNPYSAGVAWIAGEYSSIERARIPMLDQGFLRGDLTYDVPAVWDGRLFRLDDHLDRLERSCEKLRLRIPVARNEIKSLLLEMVARSGIRDAYIEIIVTRGLKFVLDYECYENNLYLMVLPYIWCMPPDSHFRGGPAVVTRTVRRIPPGAIDPTIKNLQWGDFVRGWIEAKDRNAVYALLPDGDGNVTEGGGYNICVIKDGKLRTPSYGVLEGITRKTVFEIAKVKGISAELGVVKIEELYHADEMFICSTAGGIMPLSELDGKPIGAGNVGPVTRTIWESYWAYHYDPLLSVPVKYHSPR